jgi:hypothetical protein
MKGGIKMKVSILPVDNSKKIIVTNNKHNKLG